MTMMELLTILGMDNTGNLLNMRKKSKRRMEKAVTRQMVGISLMNAKEDMKKGSE